MLRVEQALEFIEFQGSDLDRYRSRFLFDRQRDDTMASWVLGAYQNPDGGYPLQLNYGKTSNITETSKVLGYMAELDVSNSQVASRAVDYIYQTQHELGYWQESFSQLELNEDMGREWGRLWLSAYVGRNLCSIGQKNSLQIRKLRNYLLGMRTDSSRFTTSPAIHFLAMSFFALLDGSHCGLVREGLDFALNNFTTSAEPRLIVLQSECLMDAGVTKINSVLKDARKRLIELQNSDGSWGEQNDRERVRVTIDTLKVLLALGAWRIVDDE